MSQLWQLWRNGHCCGQLAANAPPLPDVRPGGGPTRPRRRLVPGRWAEPPNRPIIATGRQPGHFGKVGDIEKCKFNRTALKLNRYSVRRVRTHEKQPLSPVCLWRHSILQLYMVKALHVEVSFGPFDTAWSRASVCKFLCKYIAYWLKYAVQC